MRADPRWKAGAGGGVAAAVRRASQVAMWTCLGVYATALALHGRDFVPLVDGWLAVAVQVLPALVCWLSLPRARRRKAEVSWLCVGVTAFAAGNGVLVVAQARHTTLPVPSLADLGYMSFYPCALIAIALAVRRVRRAQPGSFWLDSALGGLAGVTVVAALLTPVFSRRSNPESLASAVSLAYPVFDLLLVFAVIAAASMQPFRLRQRWLPVVAGFTVLAGADVIYDLRIAEGTYHGGTPLEASWALGLAVMTLWTGHPAEPPAPRPAPDNGVLAVPALATLASVVVFVLGSRGRIASQAIVLAAITMVVTAVRTHLAFRDQRTFNEVRRQARTDDLTGLPNRRAFYSWGHDDLRRGSAALLLMDLDKFKEVNDSLGHHVGDQLLVEVGHRLSKAVPVGQRLARLGGDEFAVLLRGVDRSAAETTAGRIRTALAAPFPVGDMMLSAPTSIGIALAPEHGDTLGLLLRRADIAMYKAKQDRLGHRVYADSDDRDGTERRELLDELRNALTTGQLCLHFQPKLHLVDGCVRGVEALVRWNHPTRGLLYPPSFLNLVEESGLMPALTHFVLAAGLGQAAHWLHAGRTLTVAINLSPSLLLDDDLPDKIAALLVEHGVPASCLQLEITEEVLMSDRQRAIEILRRLRSAGVQISVDDFGTGYSSLAYLRELPIDELKLDRSFVAPMATDPRAAALVVSIIALAKSLDLRVVAEGVENGELLAALTQHGCDEAQGFFVSHPLDSTSLDGWLAAAPEQRLQAQLAVLSAASVAGPPPE